MDSIGRDFAVQNFCKLKWKKKTESCNRPCFQIWILSGQGARQSSCQQKRMLWTLLLEEQPVFFSFVENRVHTFTRQTQKFVATPISREIWGQAGNDHSKHDVVTWFLMAPKPTFYCFHLAWNVECWNNLVLSLDWTFSFVLVLPIKLNLSRILREIGHFIE